jgi:hypothetical protein
MYSSPKKFVKFIFSFLIQNLQVSNFLHMAVIYLMLATRSIDMHGYALGM